MLSVATVSFASVDTAHAQSCLSPAQARAALANGQAVPLGGVIMKIKRQTGGEVVGANLCHRGGRLVYVVTVLRASGATRNVVANAKSGKIIGR